MALLVEGEAGVEKSVVLNHALAVAARRDTTDLQDAAIGCQPATHP
jgi:hypothetical protein